MYTAQDQEAKKHVKIYPYWECPGEKLKLDGMIETIPNEVKLSTCDIFEQCFHLLPAISSVAM